MRNPRTAIPTSRRLAGILSALIVASLLIVAAPAAIVLAAASVTPATGGSAISADTAPVGGGSGTYTTLTGPTITEGSAGDVGTGTVVLTLPAGFEFNTASGAVNAGGGSCTGISISGLSMTATTATFTVTGPSTGACSIVYSGLQVRPTAGTAGVTGNITRSGTANLQGNPSTNMGTLAVVNGTPTVLSFTTQPSGSTPAGTAFAQQPVVHVEDRFGNDTGYSVQLSIRSGTGTSGATLTCTTNPVLTNSSGDAAFAGCAIDRAGTNYQLRATVNGVTADSNNLTITAGPATKLGFTSYPTNPSTTNLGTITVAVQDAQGNTVTTGGFATSTITLSINKNGSTFSCSGGLSKAAVAGVASFTGCTQTNATTGYSISANDGGSLTDVTGGNFDITSGPANRLALCWGTSGCNATPPTNSTGGVAFSTQPTIRVQDAAGNTVVSDDTTVVTLAIQSGTGTPGAVLTCTGGLTRTVTDGVATYSGCAIDKASPNNNPYRLVVTASGLTSATSNTFAVAVGPAVKLGFTSQPGASSVNQAFAIQPVIAVQDAGGNTVTGGASRTITLAIGTNPAAGVLTCTSGNTRQTVNGVATFSGCRIDKGGNGYTLVATTNGLTQAVSAPFNVGAAAATISLSASASAILWGEGVNFTIVFGTNGGNKTFVLEGVRDKATQPWTTIATLQTNSAGVAVFPGYTPVTNLYYRVRFAGTPDLGAGMSNEARVVVRQRAVQSPRTPTTAIRISRGGTATISTTVRPSRPELPKATVVWEFWRYSSGAWRRVTTRTAVIDSAGVARTTFTFTSVGQWRVRSRALPTPYNANSFPTPFTRYSVG